MMIDIRDHGGSFGGGKYRSNIPILIENTDLVSLPVVIDAQVSSNSIISTIVRHEDDSFTVVIANFFHHYNKDGVFQFQATIGTAAFNDILKHSNGMFYTLGADGYLRRYNPTTGVFTSLYITNSVTLHRLYELNGKIVVVGATLNFYIVNPDTMINEQTITPTKPSTSVGPTTIVGNLGFSNGKFYGQAGAIGGYLMEFDKDIINNPTIRSSATQLREYGSTGASENYIVQLNYDTKKVIIKNRLTFEVLREFAALPYVDPSYLVYNYISIDEKNDILTIFTLYTSKIYCYRIRLSDGTMLLQIDLGEGNRNANMNKNDQIFFRTKISRSGSNSVYNIVKNQGFITLK